MKLLIYFFLGGILVLSCARQNSGSEESDISGRPVDQVFMAAERDTVDSWTTEYIMGKFEPAQDTNFILVNTKHADREGMYLRKDTYAAFIRMHDAANKSGIKLVIRSATRNFEYQKGIWERKWNGLTPLESNKLATTFEDQTERARQILKYSSMPGSSRHHWGTDIDLNAFNNEYFSSGEGKEVYDWMKSHAMEYGFCQPYTDKSQGRTGYEEEKWHWSFLPVSGPLLESAQRLLKDTMIQGFSGAEQALSLQIVNNYVLGIDTTCMLRSPLN